MGEAKRRKLHSHDVEKALRHDVNRVGAALRKLATAASSHLGGDCYLHAELGRVLLKDMGYDAKRVVGYAAWRVGEGDGDVISHTPKTVGHLPAGAKGFAYHAWLECHGYIIDLTTYQLRQKAQELDALDGGSTTVAWCPDVLMLRRQDVKTYRQVAQAPKAGVAYYEAHPDLDALLKSDFTLDQADLAAARLIFANPHINVQGPRNYE